MFSLVRVLHRNLLSRPKVVRCGLVCLMTLALVFSGFGLSFGCGDCQCRSSESPAGCCCCNEPTTTDCCCCNEGTTTSCCSIDESGCCGCCQQLNVGYYPSSIPAITLQTTPAVLTAAWLDFIPSYGNVSGSLVSSANLAQKHRIHVLLNVWLI